MNGLQMFLLFLVLVTLLRGEVAQDSSRDHRATATARTEWTDDTRFQCEPVASDHIEARKHATAGSKTSERKFCPYDFAAPMPPGVYCLYAGAVTDSKGRVCAEDLGLLWSSFDPDIQFTATAPSRASRQIFLAVAARPEIVLHATANRPEPTRAEIHAYRVGDEAVLRPLAGTVLLQLDGMAEKRKRGTLSIQLEGKGLPVVEGCAFAGYQGQFLTLLSLPADAP